MAEMSNKQYQNKKIELTEEQLRQWDQLYCIVHDDDLVMYRRRTKQGKVVKFLDFRKQAQALEGSRQNE